ncbi:cell wall-binding protein [Haloferula helveola]|uniref:Cell wall-binding protein n=1 Tax=Haloferula helveola TaxID=490095 RepID=A0ABM7RF95_9BACT|nr:cell wall-binding protein [Haloferula helveola]
MRFRYLFLALSSVVFLASCGNDLSIVSKERSLRSGYSYSGGGGYTTDAPSSRVVSAGQSKPKDKHGMPLYSGDRLRHVRTTAYTCTESDHLQYGSMNAAGTPLRYSSRVRSAAADWSVYPVGTTFKIKGMPQLFVVDDYGSALTGTGTIDIYTPSKAHMKQWGRRNVEIAIVRWGSYERSAQLLSKRTHHAHCHQMYASIQRKLQSGSTAMR